MRHRIELLAKYPHIVEVRLRIVDGSYSRYRVQDYLKEHFGTHYLRYYINGLPDFKGAHSIHNIRFRYAEDAVTFKLTFLSED